MNKGMDRNFQTSSQLNKFPVDWKVKPFWSITKKKSETNNEGLDLLSVYLNQGVVRFDDVNEKRTNVTSEDTSKYQKVERGNLVLNNQQAWRGSVGVSRFEGIVSPAYIVLELSEELETGYSNYLFRDQYMVDNYAMSSKGVGSIQRNIFFPILRTTPVPIPPFQEQKLISRYLDKKTSQIDSLVEKIQKRIQLLKEQRTSLINHYVTKGLDPNVEMKDSGVEWIGEIPKHWEVTRLKYHGEVLIGLSFDKDDLVDEGQGTLVLRSSNVQNGQVNFSDNVWVKSNVPDKLFVQQGDILICSRNGSRNLIGKNCLLGQESLGMTWGVFMSVFRSRYSEFFYWILNSQVFTSQSGLFLTSTINQLTVSTLENLVFPFVSDTTEQNKINEILKTETKLINELIDKEQTRISLLREYRQSVISSAVTGKVRVTEDLL